MERLIRNDFFQNPFGGGMNPMGGGSNGVLETIQQQVMNNGQALQSLQSGIGGLPVGNLPPSGIGGNPADLHKKSPQPGGGFNPGDIGLIPQEPPMVTGPGGDLPPNVGFTDDQLRADYDKAVEVAANTANAMKVGDPFDADTKMGPISNKTQYEKVQRMIQIGIDEGATLSAGGVGLPDGCESGYYVKPTIFSDVTNDMTIAREEIFGPVLCLIKYETEEEAIEIANDTPYGLAGYVQGEHAHAVEVASKIRAGQITINKGARVRSAPFGGYGSSGNGREHGTHGLEECLETKAVIGALVE